ncbi:hypothetical protein GYB14_06760 [bacterium]|nr:hypothetical protein [bacterium]
MAKFSLRLLGVLELRDGAGQVCTPRLAKTQALLAILAVAKGAPVHRARLQDLLWSDRAPRQGRDSLRKALSDLKKCFGSGPDNPVETIGGPVRLDAEKVDVDLWSSPVASALYTPQFLEGIDIRDCEFNIWLAEVRARLVPDQPAEAQPRPPSPAAIEAAAPDVRPSPLFEIGFLPANVDGADPKTARVAQLFMDNLAELMEQSAVVRVYDFRWQRTGIAEASRGPDVFLNLSATSFGDEIVLTSAFLHVATNRTILASTVHPAMSELNGLWLARQSAALFDQLCEKMVRFDAFGREEHVAAKKVFAAVDRTFRLTNCDLDQAGAMLDEACAMIESSTAFAWNAFLTAFRVEKLGRARHPDLLARAEYLAAKAFALDPHNPLTVALVAHVYGFVLRDKDRAAELLVPMREQSQKVPMLADSLAMHCFYTGDFRAARAFASEAAQVGRFNPFRYSFTTSLAMCNLMTGDYGPAISNAKAALAQHPVRGGHLYEPTLRTLAAAAGLAGEVEVGRHAYRILSEQGNYSPLEHLASGDAPFPNAEVLAMVKQGMEALHVS